MRLVVPGLRKADHETGGKAVNRWSTLPNTTNSPNAGERGGIRLRDLSSAGRDLKTGRAMIVNQKSIEDTVDKEGLVKRGMKEQSVSE